MLVVEAARRVRPPKVPVVYIESKDREEENPNDPTYQQDFMEYKYHQGKIVVDVYLAFGSQLLEVGRGVHPVESTEWSEDLKIVGVEVPETGRARYLAWATFYALTDDDAVEMQNRIGQLNGIVLNAEVDQATDTFRDTEERPADTGAPTVSQVGDEHRNGSDVAGAGAGTGVPRSRKLRAV